MKLKPLLPWQTLNCSLVVYYQCCNVTCHHHLTRWSLISTESATVHSMMSSLVMVTFDLHGTDLVLMVCIIMLCNMTFNVLVWRNQLRRLGLKQTNYWLQHIIFQKLIQISGTSFWKNDIWCNIQFSIC